MELRDFINLFMPFGNAHVVYWDKDTEDDDEPIWTGLIIDTPYWIVANYKIGRYSKDWDAAVDLRENLGEEHNNRPGLVITLIEKEDI